MLRALVVLLIVLNALFFGWTRGWLDQVVGIKAIGDREPERMARQLHPERIQLLTPQAAAALQTTACLELGPFDSEPALQAAQAALEKAGVPATEWQATHADQPGVWAVATIKLGSKDFQTRKEETYKRMKISYEFLAGPPEELPTLVLSRHPSERAADAALENFSQRALKGLRVLQLQAPLKRHSLILPRADGNLQARLRGSGYKACAVTTPAAPAPAMPASAAASAA